MRHNYKGPLLGLAALVRATIEAADLIVRAVNVRLARGPAHRPGLGGFAVVPEVHQWALAWPGWGSEVVHPRVVPQGLGDGQLDGCRCQHQSC